MINFHAAAWFLWSSLVAASNIVCNTSSDLGLANILALYSLIIEASPLGLPTWPLEPEVLALISDFLGLPRFRLRKLTSLRSAAC